MTSQFESDYDQFIDHLSSFKAHVDEIESATESLKTAYSGDEIAKLVKKASENILPARNLIGDNSDIIESIQTTIASMAEDSTTQTTADRERANLDEKLRATDSNTGLVINPVSMTSILKRAERRYENGLSMATRLVRTLSSLVSPPPGSQPALAATHPAFVPSGIAASPASQTAVPTSVVIPPLALDSFDGSDVTLWPPFFNQLNQLVLENSSLIDPQKVCYLRNSLKGNALSLVATIPSNENALSRILSILKAEYDDPDTIQSVLVNRLLAIRPKSSSASDQLAAVRSMLSLVYSIDCNEGLDSKVVLSQAAHRIHPRFLKKVHQQDLSEKPTMLSTLQAIESDLREEIRLAGIVSAYNTLHQPTNSSQHSQPSSSQHKSSQPASVLAHPHEVVGLEEVRMDH